LMPGDPEFTVLFWMGCHALAAVSVKTGHWCAPRGDWPHLLSLLLPWYWPVWFRHGDAPTPAAIMWCSF